jgi:Trk K+ transport system NAD-binding subunit
VIIEYNPETIKYLQERNINSIYADGGDMESLEEILSPKTKMIICSSRELQTNIVILKKAKLIEPRCIVINTANTIHEAIKLYEA